MELKDIIRPAVLINENDTFESAVKLMINEQTNSLVVINQAGVLVGEVGVPDILDAVVPDYLDGDSIAAHFASEQLFKDSISDVREKPIHEFMSKEPNAVTENDSLMAVAVRAIASKRARIPVVDAEGRPLGIISRRGLKHIIAEHLGIPDHGS